MSFDNLTFYADSACTKPDPAGLFWRATENVEVAGDSVVVQASWVRWSAIWGASTFRIFAWDETRVLAEADYRRDYWPVPAQARKVTAEGRREHPGAIIAVSLIQQAK